MTTLTVILALVLTCLHVRLSLRADRRRRDIRRRLWSQVSK